MQLASHVRKHIEFQFRQGWNYEDPETEKFREIDLVCTMPDLVGACEINFIFECKRTSKPWVLFSSKETGESYSRLFSFGLMSQPARSAIADKLLPVTGGSKFEEAKKVPWFWKTGKIGYSLAQAFDGNTDVAYAAVLSAVKASLWVQSNSIWQSGVGLSHVLSFPVVVTSSPLFECSSDDDGDTQLEEIDHGHLFFNKPIGEFRATCVSIVQEEYVEDFISECSLVAKLLIKHMEPSLEAEYDKIGGRN